MNTLNDIAAPLPDGWAETVLTAPTLPPRPPTSAFLLSLLTTFGITQAELSGYLDVETEAISRWILRNYEPAPGSKGERTLNDWARRIIVIQQYPANHSTPEQWQALARGLDWLTKHNI